MRATIRTLIRHNSHTDTSPNKQDPRGEVSVTHAPTRYTYPAQPRRALPRGARPLPTPFAAAAPAQKRRRRRHDAPASRMRMARGAVPARLASRSSGAGALFRNLRGRRHDRRRRGLARRRLDVRVDAGGKKGAHTEGRSLLLSMKKRRDRKWLSLVRCTKGILLSRLL